MSNNNTSNTTLPLFNNNKSLYGTRTQTNQSSKKISIIEDKTTLEPVRSCPISPAISSTHLNHLNYQRAVSMNTTATSELSNSQIQKYIQIQKQALSEIELEQIHENIPQQLNQWKTSMSNRIQIMKSQILERNNQSYDQLKRFRHLMKTALEENVIKQLLALRSNQQTISSEELDKIEQRLEELKNEIESMKQTQTQLDTSNVTLTGDIQLNKTTDFSKHQPLPRPPPSPPPPRPSTQRPSFQSSFSVPNHIHASTSHSSRPSNPIEHKPTAPVWTDTTRQGLNSLAHYLPFRLLIPEYVRKELINNYDIIQFDKELALSCQSHVESILTIINQNDLDASIDILTDLINAFHCLSNQYELRLLFQKKFISILTGKRTERLDRLRDKYQLDMVKVFPQPCPQSDERIILIRGHNSDYIIYCLREILQNILEQAHFTDEDDNKSYPMYDPSINYDESSAHEYGGYKSNDISDVVSNDDLIVSSEDLTETKQRLTLSNSITLTSTKIQQNSNDMLLNDDDDDDVVEDDNDNVDDDENTDIENDDNEGFKQVKSSDDKKVFVKELNYVKGRQVGLLIGPFGQHITQIREQTGAKIHLTNDDNEPSVIKGTKSQINEAVRLINECLQTQKPIPRTSYKGGRRR